MAEAEKATGDHSKGPDGTTRRIVADSWYIGETLGKGGFGFVKLGYHKKNGKAFALKFIRKAESEDPQAKQQAQLVATEINCLIRIQNPYVLKLFAYRTSCVYPQQDGNDLNTIMLVLELARGGDLFDILYYTKKLEMNLARTYFFQMASGLKAIHDSGICHRDLKPQNLLLNSKFELKITDFGLSKIFEDGSKKKVMKTYYAGTQGYQAPEQILKRNFTPKCDVFSCGVILFILITGYPPCHNAHYSDPFYKYIAQVQYEKFWLKHRLNKIFDAETQDIMNKTLCYQPTDRLTVDQLLEHPWTQSDKKLSAEKLTETMRGLFKTAMEAKAKDDKKVEKLKGASKAGHRANVAEFGELPIWENRPIPRGRAFALKHATGSNDQECTRDFLEYLDDLMLEKGGNTLFTPAQLKITLKIKFERNVAGISGKMSKEGIAHVNVYKIEKSKKVFALFEFPDNFTQQLKTYEKHAVGSLAWMDGLADDVKEQIHSAAIQNMQNNEGSLSVEFRDAVKNGYNATDKNIDELQDACNLKPIEDPLPKMSEWLLPRCYDHLDFETALEDADFTKEAESENYDDMDSFFKEFNAQDEMAQFVKKVERVKPTMKTHGYVMEEEE